MSIGVTGAAGYLGRQVTDDLLNRGNDVVAFDLNIPDALRDWEEREGGLSVMQGDMTEFADLSELILGHDVSKLVHLAYFGVEKPGLMHAAAERPFRASNTNVTGFNNVLESARQLEVDTVVAASSTVVYGPPEYYRDLGIDVVDEESPLAPETMYGACKVMNEHVAAKYRELYELDLCLIRLPLIYGPNRYRGAAPFIVELFEAAANGGEVILDDGDTSLDLMYEKDIGPLFADVLGAGTYDHSTYNIVGHTTTVGKIADLAAKYGNEAAEISVTDGEDPDAPSVDDSRFRDEFDFRPEYDVDRAVADYLDIE